MNRILLALLGSLYQLEYLEGVGGSMELYSTLLFFFIAESCVTLLYVVE